MKEAIFRKGIKLESNTLYRADASRYDYDLSDTTRYYNPEYRSHTTSAGEYLDIAFMLSDLENVVLDFGGATLLFHGRILPFLLDNCKNVTIKNVKLDYDRPFYTQATVSSCDAHTMRVRFDDGFTCRVDKEHRGLVAVSDTWEYRMNRNDCLLWMYDPDDKEDHSIILALFGEEIYPKDNPPLPIGQILVEEAEDSIVFHGNFPADWCGRAGQKLVITHEPRDKSSIHTVGGEDITLDHVVIVHGSAMALTGMHTKNITVDHFDFIGDFEGNGRIVTNNADGIHLFNCYGKVEIRNCTMEGLLDDTVNIHGNFLPVTELLSDGILSLPTMYGMTPALKLFLPNDRIAVYRGQTREKLAEFTLSDVVTDLEYGQRILRVTDPTALSILHVGDIIENLSGNPEVLIENCVFRRFRGTMRMQSSRKTVIRNCRFENRETSLIMTGDTEYWYESGPVTDLTVEDCYFAHANHGWRIANSTHVKYTEKAPYYHSGVTIRNCFFDGKYACAFDHVDDITVTGNRTSSEELWASLKDCGTAALSDIINAT